MIDVIIEEGIAVPKTRKRTTLERLSILNKLIVGQSFVIPADTLAAWRAICREVNKTDTVNRFIVRPDDNRNLRVYCIIRR